MNWSKGPRDPLMPLDRCPPALACATRRGIHNRRTTKAHPQPRHAPSLSLKTPSQGRPQRSWQSSLPMWRPSGRLSLPEKDCALHCFARALLTSLGGQVMGVVSTGGMFAICHHCHNDCTQLHSFGTPAGRSPGCTLRRGVARPRKCIFRGAWREHVATDGGYKVQECVASETNSKHTFGCYGTPTSSTAYTVSPYPHWSALPSESVPMFNILILPSCSNCSPSLCKGTQGSLDPAVQVS